MKLNSNPIKATALVALLVGLSPVISAQSGSGAGGRESIPPTQTTKERTQQSLNESSRQQQQQVLRKQSANELTGMNVKSRSGDSLGRVKDFVIDASSGQVVYTLVGSGGVLGIGETLHAVPVSALTYESAPGDERLTLDIDAARWAQAPRFRKDRLSSLQAEQEGKATFEYYGQTWQQPGRSLTAQNPVRNPREGATQPSASRQEHPFVLATDIIGKNIRSGSQQVGSIEDVLIQLQSRTAAVLFDPEDSFTGNDRKYIVPFSKLTLEGTDMLTTTLTREDFTSAQVAQGDSWASPSGIIAGNLYVWQAGSASASMSPQGRSDRMARDESAARSAQQGQPPVAEIRRVLQSDTTIAQQGGKDVQVIAEGDKVVLLGTVQSKEAKDRIEERVEKAAPGWSIQNQLRVATAEE